MEMTSKWCGDCGRQVAAYRPATNHTAHLIMTLVTVGLWIIIWALASVKFGGWRCHQCGRKV